MDVVLPPELLEASLAEMPTTTASPDIVAEDGRAIFLKTPRFDIFHEHRNPRSLMLRGVSFSWEMPNANTLDYWRASDGWMVFLEADVRSVVVRIRHDNPIEEPSATLLGRTFSVFSSHDPEHYGRLMRTITDAIDRSESPLWAIALTEYLPKYIRAALESPPQTDADMAFLSPFGFQLAGEINRVFGMMKITESSHGGRQ